MAGLDATLREVVGGSSAAVLADALGLVTIRDLLGHLPRRYHERGELTDLAHLRVGEVATVQARIARAVRKPMRQRARSFLEVTVTDGARNLSLTFFNQPWRERELRVGTTAFFSGKVDDFRGRRQLTNPEVQLLDGGPGTEGGELFAGSLVPIYPATAKLPSWRIGACVRLALEALDDPSDPLPRPLRGRYRLVGLREAYELVHRPESRADVSRGIQRLKWDEALVLQVTLAQRRAAVRRTEATPRQTRTDGVLAAFDAQLPFTLTPGQRRVGQTLTEELARAFPMHRLLQGEVASGKTIVALRAMLTVVDGGGQAALLAPTEVLAVQHARNLRDLLGPLGRAGELDSAERADVATRIVLLTGSIGATARLEALAAVADGSAGLVVGTHALLQERVGFRDLGLVVVDEQHRFGVEQRDALRARARRPPHVLVMTATPIPRTVAMTVFGDLETSALTELPAGRVPLASFVVPADNPTWTRRMWGRVRDEVAAGRQAYVVCPRIGGDPEPEEEPAGGDDRRPAAAVLDVLSQLRDRELAGLRIEALHGRLPADGKDAVMTRFARGEVDVLVATTVVEVGLDVPNATVMVVLDAERFGVSQLHQLRGRVGRGEAGGWCLLHSEAEPDTPARQRLDAVASTCDGATLARLDLRQRREGDVLGVAQSGGRRTLRLLELSEDEDVLIDARAEATRLVADDPDLTGHPVLATAIRAALDEGSAAYLEKG